MKAFILGITLALSSALSFSADVDVRGVWLRGDWKRAEAHLNRAESSARRARDTSAELSVMRDRVLFLLDRNSYYRYQPEPTRTAVERFYELAAGTSDAAIKADAIHSLGRYRFWQMFSGEGDWPTVESLFKRALVLREVTGEVSALADSHFYLGLVHQMQGEPGPARAEFERGLSFAREDVLMQSFFERHLGALDEEQGNHDLAHRRYTASVELRRRAGATMLVPFALNLLASSEENLPGSERATKLYRESAMLARQTLSRRALADAEGALARLADARGDLRLAQMHAASALGAARAHGDPDLVREALERQAKLGTARPIKKRERK